MKLFQLLCCSCLLVSGCASYPNKYQIQHVEQVDAQHCKLRGSIEGSSLAGRMVSGVDIETAKSRALDQAEALRATHVVWTQIDSTYDGTVAVGEAYHCKTP